MPGRPKITITTAPQNESEGQQNSFLFPTKMGANRKRSSSVTPSEKSRITLVEEDADITSSEAAESPQGILEIKLSAPKIRWIEHVLGVFCIELPRRKKMEVVEENFIPSPKSEPASLESPWIIPVVVLSHHVFQEHHLAKSAQCTIDTGNHHGNLVSQNFLFNVMGYPEDGLLELTDGEKMGGISATDTRLIPLGAVYLDWFHPGSPRVFRKMRFLVSPHSFCDLIIGARSIEKNNILGVPILGVADVHATTNPRSATVKQLTPAISELGNTITTKEDRLKTAQGSAKDDLQKEIESNRRELTALKRGLDWRKAKDTLAEYEKSKKTSIDTLDAAKKDVEGKEKALNKALEKAAGTQVIASSSKTTTSGTDVRAAKSGKSRAAR